MSAAGNRRDEVVWEAQANGAGESAGSEALAGMVVIGRHEPPGRPAISAFIWGGKVRRVPTLPYGRWRQPAA